MPIYEYCCTECGKRHEIMQKITDAPLTACPDCGGEIKKMISNTSFVLKGTGWYATDYASSRTSPKASDSGNGEKSDTTAAKTEPKADKKPEKAAAPAPK
ncbi:MAG: zinc ribbon domain-containing protein [Nitrospiraceae bacterium]|nr:zinc ribbon domain-containing protein [Nitrospiraceae bacterium]